MKRGFTLIETLASIAILSVVILGVYSLVTSILNNNKNNLIYDDVSRIYEVYYLKEYLDINDLNNLKDNNEVKKISCNMFNEGCYKIFNTYLMNEIYLVRNLDTYHNLDTDLDRYLKLLKKDKKYDYFLVVKFKDNTFASLGVN